MSEWINVTDKLPTRPSRVLVVYRTKAGRERIIVCRYSGGEWRFLEPAHKKNKPGRVTHWMRLPMTPQVLAYSPSRPWRGKPPPGVGLTTCDMK